jgi:hypothetical protein
MSLHRALHLQPETSLEDFPPVSFFFYYDPLSLTACLGVSPSPIRLHGRDTRHHFPVNNGPESALLPDILATMGGAFDASLIASSQNFFAKNHNVRYNGDHNPPLLIFEVLRCISALGVKLDSML